MPDAPLGAMRQMSAEDLLDRERQQAELKRQAAEQVRADALNALRVLETDVRESENARRIAEELRHIAEEARCAAEAARQIDAGQIKALQELVEVQGQQIRALVAEQLRANG